MMLLDEEPVGERSASVLSQASAELIDQTAPVKRSLGLRRTVDASRIPPTKRTCPRGRRTDSLTQRTNVPLPPETSGGPMGQSFSLDK